MKLTNLTTFGRTVTRQELYNMWANASAGTIYKTDLAAGTLTLDKGSSVSGVSNPAPGTIFFDQTEQVFKVWCDEVDNTGVSLWLAVMGDRRDDAFISSQPIPPYALVAPASAGGRYVRLPDETVPRWEAYGFNLQEATIASGAWFAAGVMGYMTARFSVDSSYSHASDVRESTLDTGYQLLMPCSPAANQEGHISYSTTPGNTGARVIGYYLGGFRANLQTDTSVTSHPYYNVPIWKTELRDSGVWERT